MTLAAYDAVLRDFASQFRKVGDCFVAPADREPPTEVGLFDGIPNPQDPRSRYDAACKSVTSDEE